MSAIFENDRNNKMFYSGFKIKKSKAEIQNCERQHQKRIPNEQTLLLLVFYLFFFF